MKHENGFTLLELMIVVVIIGILAAIAIPNYTAYILRGKIAQATAGLSSKKVRMEQFFQDNRTFLASNGAPVTTPTTNDCTGTDTATSQYFDFSCTGAGVPTTSTFILQAVGKGNMTGFTFTIDQTDARTTVISGVSGWTNGTTNCWISSRGSSC